MQLWHVNLWQLAKAKSCVQNVRLHQLENRTPVHIAVASGIKVFPRTLVTKRATNIVVKALALDAYY